MSGQGANSSHAPVLYTLPIVIHIIHDNGPENISDAQVLDGIDHLNQAFANVGFYDQGTGVDTEIQFCLAKQDPDGNLTTGINRVQSPLTVVTATNDQEMKDLIRWDPLLYINFWLVLNANGYAGYAYLPGAHGAPFDGIVENAAVFGSTFENSVVTAHEMGHYLGLQHTWNGGCLNDDCLTDGDFVCDTPPDQSTAGIPCGGTMNTCDTDVNSGFTTDQNDMYWNYMDYASNECQNAFTQGQTDRMIFSIENIRFSLLDSEACNDPCTSNITADFSPSSTQVVTDEPVLFTNNSTNSTSYDWLLDGTLFSNDENPSYSFDTPGNYEIVLITHNADPNCEAKDTAYIEVNCSVQANFGAGVIFPNLGETISFVNTSNIAPGSPVPDYEWTVNGASESTSENFSYAFDISGNYTICLQATVPLCDDSQCQNFIVFGDTVGCESTFIKTFGSQNDEEEGWVITESDNGGFFMAGRKADKTLMIKIAPSGALAWARTLDLSPEDDYIQYLKLDSDGYLIGSGYSREGPLSTGFNFVFRYDHINDQFLWMKNLEWPETARFYAMLEKGANDNFFVLGQAANLTGSGCDGLLIELDRNTGDAQWMKRYHLGSCEVFNQGIIVNGEICMAGSYTKYFGQTYRYRAGISRLDFSGNEVWTRIYPITFNNNVARLYGKAIVRDGNALISASHGDMSGTSLTNTTVQLYSTSLDGDIQWAKNLDISTGTEDQVTDLVVLPDGYLLLGNFLSTAGLGRQIFLVKTDQQGEVEWSRQYGSAGDEISADLLINDGLIHLVGKQGTGSGSDFYFAKLQLDGLTLDPCDEIADLPVTNDDIPNLSDDFEPLDVFDENYDLFDFTPSNTIASGVQEGEVCGSLCSEICANGGDDDNDGYVDCYDADCNCTLDDCVVNEVEEGFATVLAWESSDDIAAVGCSPIVANLNPQTDNIPEIIVQKGVANFVTGTAPSLLIYKGDGSNADQPIELPVEMGMVAGIPSNPVVGDIDRDGIPELIVVSSDAKIRVYSFYDENNTPPMQEIIVSDDLVDVATRDAYLADFNHDGISEIYAGNDIFQFDFSVNPPTLKKELDIFGHFGRAANSLLNGSCSPVAVDILKPEDCSGDPDCEGLELVAGAYIYSVDLRTSDGDGYEIKMQRNFNVMQSQYVYSDGYTSIADVDLDGTLDVIVSSLRDLDVGVLVWNKDGLVQWFPSDAALAGSLPCVANVYDDTQSGAAVDLPEILVGGVWTLECYNINAASMGMPTNAWWTIPTQEGSGAVGTTAFDFDGNGLDEIIYRDQNDLRIIYGGNAPFPTGVDADRNWDVFICGSYSADEHSVVADVDADQQAEIVTVGYDYQTITTPPSASGGYLRTYQADLTAGGPWMGARPIWNQFNYFGVNINDDLSVPIQQQLHQLELPEQGSGHRPLNRFLSQVPLLDNDFQPYLAVPDALANVDSVECTGDSVSLTLTLCNTGSAPLVEEMPVAFYLTDPTSTAAPIFHSATLGIEILKDSCRTLSFLLPTFSGQIFAVANDDGSTATPFDLASDFPVTSFPECTYENNVADYFFNYTPPPPPDLGPDTSFCINGVFTLNAGPGWNTYLWHDGSFEQNFSGFMPGTYWVQVTDGCGSIFTDSINITEDTAAQFDLGPDADICPGDILNFSVPGFETYQWTPDLYLDCDTCTSMIATPLESTTYTLVATDAGGCVAVDSIELTTLTPTLYDTVGICAGDSLLIFGNYELESGTYFGQIPGPGNCDTLLAFTLEVAPQIELDFFPQDACENQENGSVAVEVNFGVAPFTYAWSNGAASADIDGLLPDDYGLTLTDANGCTAIGGVTLGEIGANSLTLETQDATCFGESDGQVLLLDFTPGTQFSFDGVNFTQDSIFVNIPADIYTLHVQDPSGCIFEQEIIIGQPPELIVNLPADVTIELGDSVVLASQVNTLADLAYEWSPTDWLRCNNCPEPWAVPFASTLYNLTATDLNGCSDSDDIQVNILRNLNVFIPNAFSPNGDGINDNFTVFAGTGVRLIKRFLVFDRWGEQVFEHYNFPPNDPSYGWDGTFKSEVLNPAVFIWFAEVELVDGAVELIEGDVTLLR